MPPRQMMVSCPRCRKTLIAFNGTPDIECDCHLYCDEGSQLGDCVVTWPYEWSGQLGGFQGLAIGSDTADAAQHRALGYCSTHDRYYYKDKVLIDLDWEAYFRSRPSRKLRMSLGEY